MRKSLEDNTRIKLQAEPEELGVNLGQSTEAAIYNGILASQLALVAHVWNHYFRADSEVPLFLAGGGAAQLQGVLVGAGMTDCRIENDLVMDGLAKAFLDQAG